MQKRWKKNKNWSKKNQIPKYSPKTILKKYFSKWQTKERSKNCPKHHQKNRQKDTILNIQLTKGLNSICKVINLM